MIRALVDTGCTTTIADPRIVSTMSKNNEHIIAVDGSEVMCSVGSLRLSIAGHDVNPCSAEYLRLFFAPQLNI